MVFEQNELLNYEKYSLKMKQYGNIYIQNWEKYKQNKKLCFHSDSKYIKYVSLQIKTGRGCLEMRPAVAL